MTNNADLHQNLVQNNKSEYFYSTDKEYSYQIFDTETEQNQNYIDSTGQALQVVDSPFIK